MYQAQGGNNVKQIIKISFISIMVLFTIFYSSFTISKIYINDKNEQKVILEEEEVKEQALEDNTKICLFRGENLEKEKTLKELRNEFNLDESVTEEELTDTLKVMGYIRNEKIGDEIYYTRNIEESFEPNKYYIREYEGFLAIYKTDEKGNCTIENLETDVFRDGKKFSELPEGDRDMIKNLELVYNSKEEAVLDVTDIVS